MFQTCGTISEGNIDHIGNYMVTFPTPTPNFVNLSQYDASNFIHEIPKHTKTQHICIKTVIHNMRYFMEILCYLTVPCTKPWKYMSKKWDTQCVSLVCIDRWKCDIAAFLELNPRISMTHWHPANWKIGSPFVPPCETEIHSGPRTNLHLLATFVCQIHLYFCNQKQANYTISTWWKVSL